MKFKARRRLLLLDQAATKRSMIPVNCSPIKEQLFPISNVYTATQIKMNHTINQRNFWGTLTTNKMMTQSTVTPKLIVEKKL